MTTQLRLPEDTPCRTLEGLLSQLTEEAVRWCGDSAEAEWAAAVTRAKFSGALCGPISGAGERRVSAYHAAVLRRRVIGSRSATGVAARRRLVAASIEADLRSAGWSREAARNEAWRQTGTRPKAGVA
ncbi:MAG: hypothetical protein ISP10_04725 [Aeromicrobium sp.]|jgi:hypothetical protein|nr:hypothetical protein [Aeromicrobium sp.]